MTDTLKPCPFCGKDPLSYAIEPHEHSPALKQLISDLPDHPGSHVIECVCGAGFIDETLELCAAKWNRRAHQQGSSDD